MSCDDGTGNRPWSPRPAAEMARILTSVYFFVPGVQCPSFLHLATEVSAHPHFSPMRQSHILAKMAVNSVAQRKTRKRRRGLVNSTRFGLGPLRPANVSVWLNCTCRIYSNSEVYSQTLSFFFANVDRQRVEWGERLFPKREKASRQT